MARRIKHEVLGVCSALGSIYLVVCLVSYDRWDRSLFTYSTEPVNNYGGVVGAYAADALLTVLGVAAYSLPVFGVVFGLKRLFGHEGQRVHLAGALLFMLSASVLAGLMVGSFDLRHGAGGLLGLKLGALMVGLLSASGAYIVSLALVLSSLIMLSPVSLINLVLSPGKKKKKTPKKKKPEPEESVKVDFSEPIVIEPPYVEEAEKPKPDDTEEPLKVVSTGTGEGYLCPGIEHLMQYDPPSRESREDLLESSSLLEQKLEDFAVSGKVTQVYTGPVVTMFEYEPAPGVKISRVVGLADDLALSLKATSVRIAPLAGKSALGIEIPSPNREVVSLRDIIAAESFKRSASKLTIALGKDIYGSPVVADLARMPHLLVAGATGAGKSVALNSMILSVLYKSSPDDVKMLMIDPKLLELSCYDGIPHLISPVVTNPKEAAEMLRKMVFEMERRYRLIAEKGVRNIDNFNAVAGPGEKLPYVLIIIDELADLMFVASSSVEDSIARLAQMARASGMHLVLATQRPSVDVITGVIKANFPARIAFHVTSKIDSRTIIDATGAEQLIGKGDMLFMLPGRNLVRVHGALVTEGEVKSVVDFISGQSAPDFSIMEHIDTAMETHEAEAAESAEEEARDEYYAKVVEHAQAAGEVSISSIQRRFKIGYNRAARIMDLLEQDGRVGPPRGAGKPRDFLG